jgi:hypothetical protein
MNMKKNLFIVLVLVSFSINLYGVLPESIRGFCGRVSGTILKVGEGHVVLHVSGVSQIQDDNKASKPDHLRNRTIHIVPTWVKSDSGKWEKDPLHKAFIKTLTARQSLSIFVKHAERDVFYIYRLESYQKQSAQAELNAKNATLDASDSKKKESTDTQGLSITKIEKRRQELATEIESLAKKLKELEAELQKLTSIAEKIKKGKKVSSKELEGVEDIKEVPKLIKAGNPHYRDQHGTQWQMKGRIVGDVKNSQDFTIVAYDRRGYVAEKFKGSNRSRNYEIQWLSPGIYTLIIKAPGYGISKLPGLRVKARSDLVMDLTFEGENKPEEKKHKHHKKHDWRKKREEEREREKEREEEKEIEEEEEEIEEF